MIGGIGVVHILDEADVTTGGVNDDRETTAVGGRVRRDQNLSAKFGRQRECFVHVRDADHAEPAGFRGRAVSRQRRHPGAGQATAGQEEIVFPVGAKIRRDRIGDDPAVKVGGRLRLFHEEFEPVPIPRP